MRAAIARLALAGLFGCAAARPAPPPDDVTITLEHPAHDGAAVVTAIRFSAEEFGREAHRAPAQLDVWLERLEQLVDLDPSPSRVVLRVPGGRPGDRLRVLVDTAGAGLDGLFGAPGVGELIVELPDHGSVSGTIAFPLRRQREPCAGPRLVKLEFLAPEVAALGDPGRHLACVQLPASYEASPERRYPVVFVFPGFSGLAAENDGFSARGLVDALGAELGVEVLLVGVETRVDVGTRYLVPAGPGGDWPGYVTGRLTAELDRRFRTLPRRAAYGHSTGGWNALALAFAAPGFLEAAGASSPDPLDLDVWLFDGGVVRRRWQWWQRAEERLGGRGQFHSWAASWSPDGRLLFDERGSLRPDVHAAWVRESLAARLPSAPRQLSGRLFVTAGSNDMFALYEPSQRFVERARARGLDVTWHPTALDHFGATEARFTPLVRFLLERLRSP